MPERQPPDDDPIIRSLRDAGIRPLPINRYGPSRNRLQNRLVLGAVALVFLLFVLVPASAGSVVDFLWYREVGFQRVFFTKIVAEWALGVFAGVVAFVTLYANARIALRGIDADDAPIFEKLGGKARVPHALRRLVERGAGFLALPIAALLSLFIALGASSAWRTALQFIYRTPFGASDPVFGRDVGYYVFSLPAIELSTGLALALLWLSLLLLALPIYAVRGEISMSGWRVVVRPRAQVHLAVLAALLFVVIALRIHFVDVPSLLFGEHLPLSGASYVDLRARLPAFRTLSVAALVGALLVIWGATRGRLVPMAVRAVGGYLVFAIVGALIPAAYQRLVVQPNELAREKPQIVHHIAATRQAWGIDSVQVRDLVTETKLTPQLIAANRATIDNVRLWDRDPLLQTFGQIQSIRTYYDFEAVDDDRYIIGGQLRQVLLSAREMNTEALPTRGFINEHLTYTHGMGVTLGPSNAVTPEGLPLLFIKDLPPTSSIDVRVTRPQIYYGEVDNDFVLAPSRQREFDYPAGEGDAAAYSSYDGWGGVGVGSFARRLLFAIKFGSLNILLSGDLTDRTRILYYRNIKERAARALPFLLLDSDPYLVITNSGHLQWIVDGYTTSDRYPYAQTLRNGINYMRNSVKITIDAYDGDMKAYLADPNDPIVRTLSRIYPGLLHPLDSMPADIRAHRRYPEDLFRLQTELYATYHMADPETYYHREDQWQIPSGAIGGQAGRTPSGEPRAFLRHMVMRLADEPKPEFILMRPFTPRQKDNLAAWMVARNDGEHYGKLVVYRFPRQSLVFGPNQIVNRIKQDTEVSRQITLWDQRGSEVVQGELLVLPIEGSLIYVQPIYLRAQGGRIPELKRVVAAHEGRVAMAETLDGALAGLFVAGSPSTQTVAVTGDSARTAADSGAADGVSALTRRALEHFDRARAAQRNDDWAAYGEEMKKLEQALRQLGGVRARKPQ
jgi:hypothetical protein